MIKYEFFPHFNKINDLNYRFFIVSTILIFIFQSCSTVTTSYTWMPGNEFTIRESKGLKTVIRTKYFLSEPLLEKDKIKFVIYKSRYEDTYEISKEIKYKTYNELKIEETKEKNVGAIGAISALVALTVYLVLSELNNKEDEKNTDTEIENEKKPNIIDIISIGSGLLTFIYGMAAAPYETSYSSTKKTGKQKKDIIHADEEVLLHRGTKTLVEKEPAAYCRVKISSSKLKFKTSEGTLANEVDLYADGYGQISVEAIMPNISFYDEKEAKEWIKNKIIQKEMFLRNIPDQIVNKLIKRYLIKDSLDLNIYIPGNKSQNEEIEGLNESRLIGYLFLNTGELYEDVQLREIIEDSIENIVNEFINYNINNVAIILRDIETSEAIVGAQINIYGIFEKPEKLLEVPLLRGKKLPINATKYIKPYINEDTMIKTNNDGEANFNWYLPAELRATIIHPKYNSCEISTYFSKNRIRKVIYMSRYGKKRECKIIDY